jgi:pyruvate/2-oxoglutarate dehydrogenase complex dihydrolipoamide acyltransferase (E2) component
MKAVLKMEIDGLPDQSEEELAAEFEMLLREMGRQMPVGLVVDVLVEVGETVRQGRIRATGKTTQRSGPAPAPRGAPRPRPARSPTAKATPKVRTKVALAEGILNRPRPRHWHADKR